MAELVHYFKTYLTARTTAATSATEEANYTISWANLTGAGFANGDKVVIIAMARFRNSSTNNYTRADIRVGSTFAGAATLPGTLSDRECGATSRNSPYFIVDEYTLATDDNIYFAKWVSAGTATYDDFAILVLNADDLTASNYVYAETTPSGNASASMTAGATLTSLPAGEWLILAMTRWQDDSATEDAIMEIYDGSASYATARMEGENTANVMNLGTGMYLNLGSPANVSVRYATSDGASHDCDYTKIVAINLAAFESAWGSYNSGTTSPAATDTWYEYQGNGTFALATTGNVFAFGFYTNRVGTGVGSTKNRIQVDTADWPDGNWCDVSGSDNGSDTALRTPGFTMRYGSLSNATYDFDFDYFEDSAVGNTTDVIGERSAVIFSLNLADAGTKTASGDLAASAADVSATAIREVKSSGALSAGAATVDSLAVREIRSSGVLAAGSAVIVGSAVQATIEYATGNISASTAAIVGTAIREVAAAGTLSADNAAIVGAAVRVLLATGTLSAAASIVDGTASIVGATSAFGALEADAAEIAGVAIRRLVATGALSASEAEIVGVVVRKILASGSLEAGSASITGFDVQPTDTETYVIFGIVASIIKSITRRILH